MLNAVVLSKFTLVNTPNIIAEIATTIEAIIKWYNRINQLKEFLLLLLLLLWSKAWVLDLDEAVEIDDDVELMGAIEPDLFVLRFNSLEYNDSHM